MVNKDTLDDYEVKEYRERPVRAFQFCPDEDAEVYGQFGTHHVSPGEAVYVTVNRYGFPNSVVTAEQFEDQFEVSESEAVTPVEETDEQSEPSGDQPTGTTFGGGAATPSEGTANPSSRGSV